MIVNGAYFADGEVLKMKFEQIIREHGYAEIEMKNGAYHSVNCTVEQYNMALMDLKRAGKPCRSRWKKIRGNYFESTAEKEG